MFINGNLLYAFSDNKLTAETGLMRELSKGDVVFLYKNENEGYSDMYQIPIILILMTYNSIKNSIFAIETNS